MRRQRFVRFVLVALVAGATVFLGSPADAQTQTPTSCGGVMSGQGDAELTKSLVSKLDNGNGTFTLTFQLTSTRSGLTGEFRVRDCAFIDVGGNNQLDNEAIIGDESKNVLFLNGSAQISLTVAATANDTICDRAAVSGTWQGTEFTDKSNLLCTPLSETPVIPEVPYVVLLPLAVVALLGAGVVIARRRQAGATPAVP